MSILSYQKEAASPTFSEKETGLRLNVQADSAENPGALVAHGAYLLGQPYHHLYGGQLNAAIRIVAIEQATGRVFTGFPRSPDANPITMPNDDEPTPDPRYAPLISVAGFFNVELRSHLHLPEAGGDYTVFLWLDDLVSPLQKVRLPGTERVAVPEPKEGRLTLSAATAESTPPTDDVTMVLADGRVTLSAPRGLIGAQPGLQSRPVWMTVLAHAHRNHSFAWQSQSLSSALQVAPGGQVTFKLSELIGPPQRPQKLFVLAVMGDHLSTVLVVPRVNLR